MFPITCWYRTLLVNLKSTTLDFVDIQYLYFNYLVILKLIFKCISPNIQYKPIAQSFSQPNYHWLQ